MKVLFTIVCEEVAKAERVDQGRDRWKKVKKRKVRNCYQEILENLVMNHQHHPITIKEIHILIITLNQRVEEIHLTMDMLINRG